MYIGKEFFKDQRIRVSSNPFIHKGVVIGHPFSIADIVERDLKCILPEESGIYHLFSDDVLVYIGMSKNLKNRLLGHYRDGSMEFDNILYFCASDANKTLKQIFNIEKNMIKYFKPFYNEAYLNKNH